MLLRQSLIEIIKEVVDALAKEKNLDWSKILRKLDELQESATQQAAVDPGVLTSFVSATNLLTDCVRGVISAEELSRIVPQLDPLDGWDTGLRKLIRSGQEVMLADEEATGISAIHWRKFLEIFRERLGVTDKQSEEELWDDFSSSDFELPVEDVSLADPSGQRSTWISDDGQAGKQLVDGDPTQDVYDALGLDWSGFPRESIDEQGNGTARALLMACPLHVRLKAAESLHCPSAVDGWGSLLFVPREPTGRPWPNHGCATSRPDSESPSLPEAVHGPASATTENVRILPLGHVRIGRRAVECGSGIAERALSRLRQAAGACS